MSELPKPHVYNNMTPSDIDETLSKFKWDDLIIDAKKGNIKAQHACLVKLELGLHEWKNISKTDTVDALLRFWDDISDSSSNFLAVNTNCVAHGIIEIICSHKIRSPYDTAPIRKETVDFGLMKIAQVSGITNEALIFYTKQFLECAK